ncbi:hypothetical protein [Providencia sp. PROV201]|nr:hypothetical protein [Providencia sp. PROV201]
MTKINNNMLYSTKNPQTINSKTPNKNRFARFICRINTALEPFWKLFKSPIKNRKRELNLENNIVFIKEYFSINNKYKKEIIHDEKSTSIILRTKIAGFKPNKDDSYTSTHLGHIYESNEFTFDKELSDKFNKDFNRMNIYLHTPYRQENSVEIKDAKFLSAKFGLKNAQLISQIAHQGFLAEPTILLHQINKNEHYNIGVRATQESKNNSSIESMRTNFTIKETENGSCIITANKNFEYINTGDEFGSPLPDLSISVERKTHLNKKNKNETKSNNYKNIFKLTNNKKDELKIKITKNNIENIEQ